MSEQTSKTTEARDFVTHVADYLCREFLAPLCTDLGLPDGAGIEAVREAVKNVVTRAEKAERETTAMDAQSKLIGESLKAVNNQRRFVAAVAAMEGIISDEGYHNPAGIAASSVAMADSLLAALSSQAEEAKGAKAPAVREEAENFDGDWDTTDDRERWGFWRISGEYFKFHWYRGCDPTTPATSLKEAKNKIRSGEWTRIDPQKVEQPEQPIVIKPKVAGEE